VPFPHLSDRIAPAAGDGSRTADCLGLIGQIYDAALDPIRWPPLLRYLASLSRCEALLLAAHETGLTPRQPTPSGAVLWMGGTPPVGGCAKHSVFEFELFADASTAVWISGWFEPANTDPQRIGRLLRPLLSHLRRAAEIMVRVIHGTARRDGALAALDRVTHAVVLLDGNRQVLFVNRAARRLVRQRDGITMDGNELRGTTAAASSDLRVLCEGACRSTPTGEPHRVLAIVRTPGRAPLEVCAVPIGAGGDLRGSNDGRAVALFITDVETKSELEEPTVRELFGLTVTEARVAAALASGLSVRHAADELGMRVTTLRWHLRHIFVKTKTSRQPQLISLLLGGVGAIDRSGT
jgi:DNA-binding CsgD family transcriptional regulator/PAS domain-containing protein